MMHGSEGGTMQRSSAYPSSSTLRDRNDVTLERNPAYQSTASANRPPRKCVSMYAMTSMQLASSADTEVVENPNYAETHFK